MLNLAPLAVVLCLNFRMLTGRLRPHPNAIYEIYLYIDSRASSLHNFIVSGPFSTAMSRFPLQFCSKRNDRRMTVVEGLSVAQRDVNDKTECAAAKRCIGCGHAAKELSIRQYAVCVYSAVRMSPIRTSHNRWKKEKEKSEKKRISRCFRHPSF